MSITADKARELLSYDPTTGLLTWRVRTSIRVMVGDVAGGVNKIGYVRVGVLGHQYAAHRLAWLMVTGNWPAEQVDHINGVRSDNRWTNLREASNQENMRNASMRSDNTSGAMGVTWHKASGKWRAEIRIGGKTESLGYFSELHEAAKARKAAEVAHGFHENHGRSK